MFLAFFLFLFLFLNYLHNSRCFKVDDTRIRNNLFAHFVIYMRNLGSDWLRVASGEVDVEGNMSELKAGRHHMCEVAHDPLFLKMAIALRKQETTRLVGTRTDPLLYK